MIKIGLIEIEYMPFFVFYEKSICNFNNEDIFTAWQFGRIELRKFRNKECMKKWEL